ncbi:hypothetical protein B0T22DRAFT_202185 [Podospora appendiculata]|uniref:Uncharacterized protein n=1 Tax=Podospora appendiculata TaxID=314037 RepID=A0AAE0X4K8_9PEZI|nr:hypothetical protein B0T22DRAFT_202185 [Podospora appendiculata]
MPSSHPPRSLGHSLTSSISFSAFPTKRHELTEPTNIDQVSQPEETTLPSHHQTSRPKRTDQSPPHPHHQRNLNQTAISRLPPSPSQPSTMRKYSSSSMYSAADPNRPLTGLPGQTTPTPTTRQNSHYIFDLGQSPARSGKTKNKRSDAGSSPPTDEHPSSSLPHPTLTTSQTEYMNMLLELDKIPRLHNILASCFAWILLAGFVVIPGSFSSLRALEEAGNGNGNGIITILPDSPTAATVIGFLCMGVGALGAGWLAWRWRANYVWLLNKLYMPVLLNGLAGVISTLTNVYTQQHGQWSTRAIIAMAVEGAVLVVSAGLFGAYNFWLLERVKSEHDRSTRRGNRRSLVEMVEDIRTAPPVAPGSVV